MRYQSQRRAQLAPAPPRPAPVAQPSPREVVTSYVEALHRKDYRAAYALLSARSQQLHPYEGFVKLAESAGAADLDLGAAREGEEKDGRVVVSVPIVEDPAEAAFTMVRESGRWKVVFIGGLPLFPYADEPAPAGGSD
jgi:hypothetical protein